MLKELGIVALYVLGMALGVIEMFIPGIVIGVIGIGCVMGAIYLAFGHNTTLGWTLVTITIVSVPFFIFLWVKVLNRVFAMRHTESGYTGAMTKYKDLTGKEGVAITQLRPAGTARFGDAKVDVVSEGEVIERDTRVLVIEVKSNRVVVRPVKG